MFYRYVTADDRCVIVELKGNSADVLQSSRDTLKYDCRCELDELIRQLTVDRHSAFRSDCTYYQHWEGEKLENHDQSSLPEILKIKEELAEMQNERLAATTPVESEDSEESTPIESPDHETHLSVVRATPSTPAEPMFEVDVEKHFRHDFVIKNDAAMQIPAYYTPGNFSAYSDKLCRAWVKLLLETYRTFGRCETFSVGFYFSREEDVWAEFERGDYGRVYYLNPAKVKYTATGVPVFARRWGFTWNIRYHLIVTAVHEYIHSLGFSGHDERFVQKSDECMAVVMKNLKRFRACFQ